MKNNKNQKETEVVLDFSAKVLSWELGETITPFEIFIAFKAHLLTGALFKDCVIATHEAYKTIKN